MILGLSLSWVQYRVQSAQRIYDRLRFEIIRTLIFVHILKQISVSKGVLIVFVKNPVLGQVKSRLASSVGEERALRIYQALVSRIADEVRQLKDIAVAVYYSAHLLEDNRWPSHAHCFVQSEGDIGRRMCEAIREQLRTHRRVVLVGTDIAGLTASVLRRSFDLLDAADVVLGPTYDGGYYLIGMKTLDDSIFEGIPWSTEEVFIETTKRIQLAELVYDLTDRLSDIDYEEDWLEHGWEID